MGFLWLAAKNTLIQTDSFLLWFKKLSSNQSNGERLAACSLNPGYINENSISNSCLGKILDFWAYEVKEGWIKMRLKRPDSSGDSETKSPEKTDALCWLAQNQLSGQGALATFPEACGSHLAVIFPSRGHLAVFEDILGCHLQRAGVIGIKWVEVRDAPKHLTKYRDPPQPLPPPPLPTRNYPAEDVPSKNACMLSHFSRVQLYGL